MPPLLTCEDKACVACGATYNRKRLPAGRWESPEDYRQRKYCSRKCFFRGNTGEAHWRWSGGLRRRRDGYVRFADDRYVHRVTMEAALGRPLQRDEHVHHVNGDSSDNCFDNLKLISASEHSKLHSRRTQRDEKGRWTCG